MYPTSFWINDYKYAHVFPEYIIEEKHLIALQDILRSNLIFYPWNTPYFQAFFTTLTEWLQKHTVTAATNALHLFLFFYYFDVERAMKS